jgi:hypothetical protein
MRRARLEQLACIGPAAEFVQKVVLVAAFVSGCHAKRFACDALPPLAISREEGTDAEYMPGYPEQDVVFAGKPYVSSYIAESDRIRMVGWLREHGEAPLVRLAGKGDAARCVHSNGYTRFTGVGRMLHTPNVTRHSVQNMDRCEKGPHPFVGRRYDRTTDEGAWAKLDQCLRESGFDRTPLGLYSDYSVTHGESSFLEAVRDGRYHAILLRESGFRRGGGRPLSPLECCDLLRGYSEEPGQATEKWPPSEHGIIW